MGVTPVSVPPNIANSLVAAGDKSGVDFDYLLQTAIRESSLNPHAKAPTSSAVGLFQFLESTWLEVMKSDGPRLGYQKYADAIVEDDGVFTIKDSKLRAEVLKLREDPQISADLAAAFTRNNGAYLHERFGRMPSPGELYIAHFLGAKGAAKLFTAGLSDPDQSAVRLFPRQARANPSIFYDHGKPRTIRQVYKALIAQHLKVPPTDAGFAVQQMATAPGGSGGPPPLPAPVPLEPPAWRRPAGNQPGQQQAAAAAPAEPVAAAPATTAQPRWPGEVVPSRVGPEAVSFTTLFSSGEAIAPRTLLTRPEEPAPQSLFFTQLHAP